MKKYTIELNGKHYPVSVKISSQRDVDSELRDALEITVTATAFGMEHENSLGGVQIGPSYPLTDGMIEQAISELALDLERQYKTLKAIF